MLAKKPPRHSNATLTTENFITEAILGSRSPPKSGNARIFARGDRARNIDTPLLVSVPSKTRKLSRAENLKLFAPFRRDFLKSPGRSKNLQYELPIFSLIFRCKAAECYELTQINYDVPESRQSLSL